MTYWDKYWSRVGDSNKTYYDGASHIADSILRSMGDYSRILYNSSIVELGGGGGRISMEIAKRFGCDVTLVDYSTKGLEIAEKLFKREGMRVKTVKNDVFDLDLGGFDFSFSVGLAEHYDKHDRSKLAAIHNGVLKDNGMSVISAPNGMNVFYKLSKGVKRMCNSWVFEDENDVNRLEIINDMVKSGFEIIGVDGFDFLSSLYFPLYIMEKDGNSNHRGVLSSIRLADRTSNRVYRLLSSYLGWNICVAGAKNHKTETSQAYLNSK